MTSKVHNMWFHMDLTNLSNTKKRTALCFPVKFQKQTMCDAYNKQLSGHDAVSKTYIRISDFYFLPGMKADIKLHIESCVQCQVWKKAYAKSVPLQPLPLLVQPNPAHSRWFVRALENILSMQKKSFCVSQMLSPNTLKWSPFLKTSCHSGHWNYHSLDLLIWFPIAIIAL